jgi:hypothetical protein
MLVMRLGYCKAFPEPKRAEETHQAEVREIGFHDIDGW